jgi:hypothetical protein
MSGEMETSSVCDAGKDHGNMKVGKNSDHLTIGGRIIGK